MPYVRDVERVIAQVLANQNISEALQRPPQYLNADFLRAQLRQREAAIWGGAEKTIQDFDRLQGLVEEQRAQYERAQNDLPGDIAGTLIALGFALLASLVGFFFWLGGAFSLSSIAHAIWTSRAGQISLGLVAAWAVYFTARLLYWNRLALPPRLKKLAYDLHLNDAEERLRAAMNAADAGVGQSALQTAGQIINEATPEFFQDGLIVRTAGDPPVAEPLRETVGLGLSEVLTSAHQIGTSAISKIRDIIRNLPGASIGIAGPRGVGKSTLLWSLCRSNPPDGVVAICTSAPVEYEWRDFLLHIYATLCREVLRVRNLREDSSVPIDDELGAGD